jgi:post-segregation antitoxin (ccd killing protein)
MNEIERLKSIDVNGAIAQALREQAEREKGCVWCKGNNKVFHDGQHFHFFCSYCGKRLEEHHET